VRNAIGAMLAAMEDRILATLAAKMEERLQQQSPPDQCGTIMKGTWNPADGTAEVLYDNTAAVFTDQGKAPSIVRMKIDVPHVGDQTGPDGDERVHIQVAEDGLTAKMIHGPDDSPGAVVGQRLISRKKWIQLQTVAGGIVDLNDTTKVYTVKSPGGHMLTMDDGGKAVTMKSAGGLAVILNDNTGKIELGKDGLSQPDSVMTQTDAQTLANSLVASVQAAFATFAAHVQSGQGTTPPTVSGVTAQGSQVVDSEE